MPEPADGRTVLVLPAWYPSRAQPLAGPFVRDHARAAAAYGHRMAILVDEGPDDGVRGLFSLAEERDGDLRIFRLRYRRRALRLVGVLATLTVARRVGAIDLLHAHVHRMGWTAVLAGSLLRKPVVISEHSSEWPTGQMTPAKLRRARFAFRRAALVCPVSESLRRAIERDGIHARFRVVPNAVDTGVFRPPAARSEGALRLVNVALHVEVKALDVLLQAFAMLTSEPTLELVGEGPLTPALKELAGKGVTFTGSVSPEEVAERLRAADVFVLSSRSENLPLSVLEALCTGLPVVATDVGGVAEAVRSDGALVPSDDAEALTRAIEDVGSRLDSFDRADIAKRAAARWSFEAVGATWDEIYRSLS